MTSEKKRRSLHVSSNLLFDRWDRTFQDPLTIMAAVDRQVHHSIILECDGGSRRVAKASGKVEPVTSKGGHRDGGPITGNAPETQSLEQGVSWRVMNSLWGRFRSLEEPDAFIALVRICARRRPAFGPGGPIPEAIRSATATEDGRGRSHRIRCPDPALPTGARSGPGTGFRKS